MQRRGETASADLQERVEESGTYVPACERDSGLETARTSRSPIERSSES